MLCFCGFTPFTIAPAQMPQSRPILELRTGANRHSAADAHPRAASCTTHHAETTQTMLTMWRALQIARPNRPNAAAAGADRASGSSSGAAASRRRRRRRHFCRRHLSFAVRCGRPRKARSRNGPTWGTCRHCDCARVRCMGALPAPQLGGHRRRSPAAPRAAYPHQKNTWVAGGGQHVHRARLLNKRAGGQARSKEGHALAVGGGVLGSGSH